LLQLNVGKRAWEWNIGTVRSNWFVCDGDLDYDNTSGM